MSMLEARLARLEAATDDHPTHFVICRFESPGGTTGEVVGYGVCGSAGPTWHRHPGESVEALRERAKQEAKSCCPGGIVALVECYADDLAA
jgi:hypothetical protein